MSQSTSQPAQNKEITDIVAKNTVPAVVIKDIFNLLYLFDATSESK